MAILPIDRFGAETEVSIEKNAFGEQAGKVLQLGSGDSGGAFQSFNNANRDNVEILAKYRTTTVPARQSIIVVIGT